MRWVCGMGAAGGRALHVLPDQALPLSPPGPSLPFARRGGDINAISKTAAVVPGLISV